MYFRPNQYNVIHSNMIFQVYYSVSGYRTQGTMQKTKPGEGVQLKGDWVRPDRVLIDGLNHSKLEPKGFSFPLGVYLCEGSGFIS